MWLAFTGAIPISSSADLPGHQLLFSHTVYFIQVSLVSVMTVLQSSYETILEVTTLYSIALIVPASALMRRSFVHVSFSQVAQEGLWPRSHCPPRLCAEFGWQGLDVSGCWGRFHTGPHRQVGASSRVDLDKAFRSEAEEPGSSYWRLQGLSGQSCSRPACWMRNGSIEPEDILAAKCWGLPDAYKQVPLSDDAFDRD